MNDDLVGFEVAKLAKGKGFNWKCNWYCTYQRKAPTSDQSFYPEISEYTNFNEDNKRKFYELFSLPTQSLLQRWLRTVHNIHIELIIDGCGRDNKVSDSICYRAFIWEVGKPKPGVADDLGCSDYEKILEVALHDALLLIKDK